MKLSVVYLLSLLGVVASAEIKQEEGVLVLDDSNFDEAIKSNDLLLVEFYAPWCGHCKKLAPEWASAAATLNEAGVVRLAKVDATEAKDLGTRFGIKGFPTIKVFRSGEVSDYQGGRSASDIVNYAKKISGPAARSISAVADILNLKDEHDVFVVGHFSSATSDNAKAFLAVAAKDDDTIYGISETEAVSNFLKTGGDVKGDTVVVFKPSDNEQVHLAVGESFDKDAVSNFIAANRLPLINEFSPENTKKIFGSSIKKHGLFFTAKDSDYHNNVLEAMRAAGNTYRGKVLMVRVPSTESKVLEYFGLKADSLPAFVLADMSGEGQMKKYFFSGSYDAASVTSFIGEFLNGNLKQVLKSEEVLPSDLEGPVKIVKGKSFNDIVLNNDKDVLVEFYAPWCGHCKKLEPTWIELGNTLKDVPSVVIAKCDATANEFDVPGLNIKGFPTIYYFKGSDKKAQIYNGGREIEDFVEFLHENGVALPESVHSHDHGEL